MRVLFVASECYPLVKTGGLADVVGALPLALAGLGCDARVLIPAYPGVRDRLQGVETVLSLGDLIGASGALLSGRTGEGLPVLLLDAPDWFARPGNPYLAADGKDWPDNAQRFAALAWAASRIALGALEGWRPDLVHAHDWQAGLTPAYLAHSGQARCGQRRPPTLLTIHNLAFQGVFPARLLAELRLPPESFAIAGVEFHDQIGFLKAGLHYADHISTVSPTYAQEIRTPELGMGLDGVLRTRHQALTGILNGIDDALWNPASDPLIGHPYGPDRLSGKLHNKMALQTELGLAPGDDQPLFCVISRLTQQKGLDLLTEAMLRGLTARGGQLAVLGAGDAHLQAAFSRAAARYPGRIAVVLGYDEALSHRIQAGADAIIIPSRFEPCGLTQLYGLRYGTLPIVSRVGGLADTVIDANVAALRDGVATGFQFSPTTTAGLGLALDRVFALFAAREAWRLVQRRAMTRDVGWSSAAEHYQTLYHSLLPSH
ncbi:MAG: glycogen synthase GlgA [Azospirillum sp.]|nr:glycogen synthase GlgA [Azospirillum sp.]